MHRYIIVNLKMHNIYKMPKGYSLGIFFHKIWYNVKSSRNEGEICWHEFKK